MTVSEIAGARPQIAHDAPPDRTARPATPGPWSLLGATIRPILLAGDTGGRLTYLEAVIPPRGVIPAHTHAWEDETWHVLEGCLDITVGGVTQRVWPGSCAFGPRGVEHGFANPLELPARYLLIYTPGGCEHFFAEGARLCAGGGRPDPQALRACFAAHGITL